MWSSWPWVMNMPRSFVLVGHKIGKIGDDQIDAVHVFLREAHAAVDHDHILPVLQDGTVLADLVKAAQRDNFQFFCQMNQ